MVPEKIIVGNRHRRPPSRGFPGIQCFGPQICPSPTILIKLAEALEQVTTEPVTKNKKSYGAVIFYRCFLWDEKRYQFYVVLSKKKTPKKNSQSSDSNNSNNFLVTVRNCTVLIPRHKTRKYHSRLVLPTTLSDWQTLSDDWRQTDDTANTDWLNKDSATERFCSNVCKVVLPGYSKGNQSLETALRFEAVLEAAPCSHVKLRNFVRLF